MAFIAVSGNMFISTNNSLMTLNGHNEKSLRKSVRVFKNEYHAHRCSLPFQDVKFEILPAEYLEIIILMII